ncbi:MAG TPA: hypothetical protein VFM38_03550, partial [Candidatus Limnocylindrales bacterium]|nr:hypothetical protein [Candidatus Limnocylindrales bacterium]
TSTQAQAAADARGGSGSVLIAVTLMTAVGTVSGSTRAYVGHLGNAALTAPAIPAQFWVGSLDVKAKATDSRATATLLSVSVGLLGAGSAGDDAIPSKATVSGAVEAWVEPATAGQATNARVAVHAGANGITIKAESSGITVATVNGGAGSVGGGVTILQGDAETSLGTKAWVGPWTTIYAGKLDVAATTLAAKATANVTVGTGSVLAGGGRAEANATISSGASAWIGDDTFVQVTDGFARVAAATTALGKSGALIATASGVAGGREAEATTKVSGSTLAWLGERAHVAAILVSQVAAPGVGPGDVIVTATARAEGDAKGEAYGGEVVAGGGQGDATVEVTPSVRASVNAAAQVMAYGDAVVTASFTRGTSNLTTALKSIDLGKDTFAFDLELANGQIVFYVPAFGLPSVTPLVSGRPYTILVLSGSPDLYRFGGAFSTSNVDPVRDVITFDAQHYLLEGDRLIFNGPPISTFDPALAVGDPSDPQTQDTITLPFGSGLQTGDRVSYRIPVGGTAIGGLVDGGIYYVTVDPSNVNIVRLSATNGGPVIPLDGSVAVGTNHRFDPVIGGLTLETAYLVHVVDDYTIKLRQVGVTYTGPKLLQPLFIDSATDTITMTAHGFAENAPVTYHAPNIWGQFGATAVNKLYIALTQTFVSSPGLIYIKDHPFSTGDRVVFEILKGDPIGGLTNGNRYSVIEVNAYDVSLTKAYATGLILIGTANGHAQLSRLDGQSWAAFGFGAGDTFTLSTCTGYNGSYTVDSLVGPVMVLTIASLTDGFCAGTLATPTIIPTPVVHSDPALDGFYQLTRPTDYPISYVDGGGSHYLVDGATYYVHRDAA